VAKSLGAAEKFHGAVVDHGEAERTRVFQDVAAHGAFLKHLDAVVGTTVRPEVALVYDTEVRWALMYSQGPRQTNPARLRQGVRADLPGALRPFWKLGIPVDVIESLSDFTRYRLVVAPMLFMLKPGVADRLDAFVKGGGTLVLTYLSGVVNETELVLRGGWPGGGLRKLAGIWSEEVDALYPNPPQRIVPSAGNALGMTGEHPVKDYCERIHRRARRCSRRTRPTSTPACRALTVNKYGAGQVFYLAAGQRLTACSTGSPRAGVAVEAVAVPGRRTPGGSDRAETIGRRAHVLFPAQTAGARIRWSISDHCG